MPTQRTLKYTLLRENQLFSRIKLEAPPDRRVIPFINMRLSGSFQPISSATGIMIMREITGPLRAPLQKLSIDGEV